MKNMRKAVQYMARHFVVRGQHRFLRGLKFGNFALNFREYGPISAKWGGYGASRHAVLATPVTTSINHDGLANIGCPSTSEA